MGEHGYQPAQPARAEPASPGAAEFPAPAGSEGLAGSDVEFLQRCAELTARLRGLGDQLDTWVETLTGLGLPTTVTAPLHAAAGQLAEAADRLTHAAAAFETAYENARRLAARGITLTGDDPT